MAWGRSRVGTLVLCTLILHSLASSAVGQPATASSSDVLLGFAPPRWYNPSVIGYSGRVFCAIKLTDFKKVGGKVWWLNSIQMCAGNSIDSLQELQCEHFQPWDAQSTECELGPHVRGGKVDSQGLGDTKVRGLLQAVLLAALRMKTQTEAQSRRCGIAKARQSNKLVNPPFACRCGRGLARASTPSSVRSPAYATSQKPSAGLQTVSLTPVVPAVVS